MEMVTEKLSEPSSSQLNVSSYHIKSKTKRTEIEVINFYIFQVVEVSDALHGKLKPVYVIYISLRACALWIDHSM